MWSVVVINIVVSCNVIIVLSKLGGTNSWLVCDNIVVCSLAGACS